jgi:hypothetical protein
MSDEQTDSEPGKPRIVPDIEVECNVVVEYGIALAAAAERCLRYPDRMREARSEDERAQVRSEHLGFVRRVIGANTIAIAVLGEIPARPVNGSPEDGGNST